MRSCTYRAFIFSRDPTVSTADSTSEENFSKRTLTSRACALVPDTRAIRACESVSNPCKIRATSAASNAVPPLNIRSRVAASPFQDRIVDFNDEFAHADPTVAATINVKIKIFVLIGTIRSASALAAAR